MRDISKAELTEIIEKHGKWCGDIEQAISTITNQSARIQELERDKARLRGLLDLEDASDE